MNDFKSEKIQMAHEVLIVNKVFSQSQSHPIFANENLWIESIDDSQFMV